MELYSGTVLRFLKSVFSMFGVNKKQKIMPWELLNILSVLWQLENLVIHQLFEKSGD